MSHSKLGEPRHLVSSWSRSGSRRFQRRETVRRQHAETVDSVQWCASRFAPKVLGENHTRGSEGLRGWRSNTCDHTLSGAGRVMTSLDPARILKAPKAESSVLGWFFLFVWYFITPSPGCYAPGDSVSSSSTRRATRRHLFTCSPARARGANANQNNSIPPANETRAAGRGGAFVPRAKRQRATSLPPRQCRTHALRRCMDYGVSLQLQHEPAEPPTRLPRACTLQLQVRAHSLTRARTRARPI